MEFGFTDVINPGSVASIRGIFINGTEIRNQPAISSSAKQRLAWPRDGATCDGEITDCSYVPEAIKVAQVLIAYNFLKSPSDVPGAPGGGASAPAGTYVKTTKN